ncbi:MAG: AAA family ATPase, partial [Bacilli bacterium]|nr:AAA family ATPase [Bacilli bacterium]
MEFCGIRVEMLVKPTIIWIEREDDEMLTLPIGLDDFSKAKNYYYVDKTLLIKDIIDFFQYRTVLFTKPRRFGKSLNLSMVEYFFSNHGDNRSLFADLKIAKEGEDYLAHQGRYPVVHINFKDISASSYEDFCNDIIRMISSIFRNFPELIDSKSPFEYDKENYLNIANKRSGNIGDYADALKTLTQLLYLHYDKTPCVVLIDEYDTPLSIAYQNGFFEQAVLFFRKFYSSISKSNPYTFFVLLTGITEISKESIFSEMNNADVYTVVDEEYSQYFGFTQGEIEKMFAHFGKTPDIDMLRRYYGGYGEDGSLFNPWSILNYLNRGSYEPYWINTGSNFAIKEVLGDDKEMIEATNDILNNKESPFLFYRGISYRDLKSSTDILYSLLVHAGYLSIKRNED